MLFFFFSFFLYLHFISGNFCYTSNAGFIFYVGSFSCISTHPELALIGSSDFHLHIPCWFHFYWGVSLTHPVLASFLSGEFLLHIHCWLYFYEGSFSYTSRGGFIFILGVSLTRPMLALLFCGEFLLHIPCWLHFLSGEFLLSIPCWLPFLNLGSFSYTSIADIIFILGSFS